MPRVRNTNQFLRTITLPRVPLGTHRVHFLFVPARARSIRLHLAGPVDSQAYTVLEEPYRDKNGRAQTHVRSLLVREDKLVEFEVRSTQVAATSDGEQCELSQAFLEDDKGKFRRVEGPAGCLEDIDWVTAQSSPPPFTQDQYSLAVENALTAAGDTEETRARRFFFHLSKYTNDFFPESAPFMPWVDNAMLSLSQRQKVALVDYRASTLDCSTLPRPSEDDVKGIGALVEKCIKEAAITTEAELQKAFELFANGDLRLPLPALGQVAIQPSSGYFFLFAELFYFVHSTAPDNLTKDLWLKRARFATFLQEVFTSTFKSSVAPPKLDIDAYSACNYLCEQARSRTFIDGLAASYPTTAPDICAKMAENTDRFLKDLPTA